MVAENRSQRDAELIFLRSMFLPYPDFYAAVTAHCSYGTARQN
jgi:hypothetical protein